MRHASFALPWVLAAVAVPAPVLAAETPRHWLLSVSDVSVSEESCAPHQAVFTVRLFKRVHNLPPRVVTVQYATADGSAVGGVDYVPASGTLTFTPPSLVLTVAVPITDALVPGPDKTFTLQLSNPSGAIFGRPVGTATLHAPTVAKCASCALSCDDGEACTTDSCDTVAGCRNVDLARCNNPHAATLPLPNGSFCTPITSCSIPDADGDGLNDAWEDQGYVDMNCDGAHDAGDLDLPGSDPLRKDLYLQYDYMDGTATVGHSHEPAPEALQAVVDAFDRQGIALHAERGAALPHSAVVTFDPVVPTCAGDDAVNFYDVKAAHFDPARRPAYHYAVFGHYNTCDSAAHCSFCPGGPIVGGGGLAEVAGNDFIVSLGAYFDFGTLPPVESEAGVSMHELGHNLGLRHGGDQDVPEFKPNLFSVINGNFTYPGIPVSATPGSTTPQACAAASDCPPEAICASSGTCTRIDYSSQALPDLEELHLDENLGIAAGSSDITTYGCPDQSTRQGAGAGPVDWNCDDDPTDPDVAVDLNTDGQLGTLTGHDDWGATDLVFQCTANGSADGPPGAPEGLSQEPSVRELREKHRLYALRTVLTEVLAQGPASALAPAAVTVAILGAEGLDASAIDLSSLRLARARVLRSAVADVNGDGRPDLVAGFALDGRMPSMATVSLTGWLRNTQAFVGTVSLTSAAGHRD